MDLPGNDEFLHCKSSRGRSRSAASANQAPQSQCLPFSRIGQERTGIFWREAARGRYAPPPAYARCRWRIVTNSKFWRSLRVRFVETNDSSPSHDAPTGSLCRRHARARQAAHKNPRIRFRRRRGCGPAAWPRKAVCRHAGKILPPSPRDPTSPGRRWR